MKHFSLLLVFLAVFLTGCTRISVEPGQEAIKIRKPWIFGHGGIVEEPIPTGLSYAALSSDYVSVDVTPVLFDEEFNDIMPKDNNPVDYHAAVRIQITDSVKLVKKYGVWYQKDSDNKYALSRWYVTNVQRPFQNMNRNQVRHYSMPELALNQDVVENVERQLEKELTDFFKKNDMPAKVIEISLGRISPQKEIIDAYNETGVQQQRAKTEAQRANAEVARKQAETARAQADRAYQDAMGLTAQQYIQLQQIKMCAEKANCSVFLGATPVPVVGK